MKVSLYGTCTDPESCVRGGPTLKRFFKRSEAPKITKSGQLSANHRNAIEMAFCWRADNGPPLNADLAAL